MKSRHKDQAEQTAIRLHNGQYNQTDCEVLIQYSHFMTVEDLTDIILNRLITGQKINKT